MPKSAKCDGQKHYAVYAGWLWRFKSTGVHFGKRGGVYEPIQEVPQHGT